MSAKELVADWLDSLRPGTVRELFEYQPNTMYFAKDTELLQPYINLAPVIDFLNGNFTTKIPMIQLAKPANMSVRQLERRFRETFHMTPMQYLTKRRILHACDLLTGTSMQITEIALEKGFYDHSSFSKKFSEMMGTAPSAYRKKFKRAG